MTALREILRAALNATEGDALAAVGVILRRCEEPLVRKALIVELAPELQAQAPEPRSIADEAEAGVGGNVDRLEQILHELDDPQENPKLAVQVGQAARHALVRVLLAAVREEKGRGTSGAT